MKKKRVKIQSVSDIITNSSTEVFMIYDEAAFKSIKELANAILALGNSDKTFDDLFEIKASVSESFFEDYPEYEGKDENEILERARKEDKWRDDYPYVDGYEVTAKNPADADAAKILSKIDNIFDTYAQYC
jgi:hypothetical protein